MKVKVIIHGILSDWLGTEEVCLELPQGASLRGLMHHLKESSSPKMPRQLWDPEKDAFVGQVLATRGAQPLRDLDSALEEGEEIHFFLLLAGG